MKLKDILNRNFNSLNHDELKFFEENQENHLLGVCDKYNIITNELIYVEYDFEELSDHGIAECEKNNYVALCREAWEELM